MLTMIYEHFIADAPIGIEKVMMSSLTLGMYQMHPYCVPDHWDASLSLTTIQKSGLMVNTSVFTNLNSLSGLICMINCLKGKIY